MASIFDINNKLSYNHRKIIKYIDNNITNIPNNNMAYCMNYLLCKNKNENILNFCKCQNN